MKLSTQNWEFYQWLKHVPKELHEALAREAEITAKLAVLLAAYKHNGEPTTTEITDVVKEISEFIEDGIHCGLVQDYRDMLARKLGKK